MLVNFIPTSIKNLIVACAMTFNAWPLFAVEEDKTEFAIAVEKNRLVSRDQLIQLTKDNPVFAGLFFETMKSPLGLFDKQILVQVIALMFLCEKDYSNLLKESDLKFFQALQEFLVSTIVFNQQLLAGIRLGSEQYRALCKELFASVEQAVRMAMASNPERSDMLSELLKQFLNARNKMNKKPYSLWLSNLRLPKLLDGAKSSVYLSVALLVCVVAKKTYFSQVNPFAAAVEIAEKLGQGLGRDAAQIAADAADRVQNRAGAVMDRAVASVASAPRQAALFVRDGARAGATSLANAAAATGEAVRGGVASVLRAPGQAVEAGLRGVSQVMRNAMLATLMLSHQWTPRALGDAQARLLLDGGEAQDAD